jgi:hypothetical protein
MVSPAVDVWCEWWEKRWTGTKETIGRTSSKICRTVDEDKNKRGKKKGKQIIKAKQRKGHFT